MYHTRNAQTFLTVVRSDASDLAKFHGGLLCYNINLYIMYVF